METVTQNQTAANAVPEKKESSFRRYIRHKFSALRHMGASKITLFTVVFILFLVYALSLILPFAWMFINSFSKDTTYWQDSWAFRFDAGFDNYASVFTTLGVRRAVRTVLVGEMFLYSVIAVGGGVICTLISCSVGSYVVAKYKFPGRGFIYNMVLVAMMIPIVGTLPAQIRLMQTVGLDDSFVGVWFLYSGGFGFNFLFMYAYFKGISWGYAEAAQIDGASHFRIFIQIMIPMAKPALTAVGVLTFMSLWGDYQTPYYFLNSYPTLAVGLKELIDPNFLNYPQLFAMAIIVSVPVITVFCIFQKTIMNNLTMGGLKG